MGGDRASAQVCGCGACIATWSALCSEGDEAKTSASTTATAANTLHQDP